MKNAGHCKRQWQGYIVAVFFAVLAIALVCFLSISATANAATESESNSNMEKTESSMDLLLDSDALDDSMNKISSFLSKQLEDSKKVVTVNENKKNESNLKEFADVNPNGENRAPNDVKIGLGFDLPEDSGFKLIILDMEGPIDFNKDNLGYNDEFSCTYVPVGSHYLIHDVGWIPPEFFEEESLEVGLPWDAASIVEVRSPDFSHAVAYLVMSAFSAECFDCHDGDYEKTRTNMYFHDFLLQNWGYFETANQWQTIWFDKQFYPTFTRISPFETFVAGWDCFNENDNFDYSFIDTVCDGGVRPLNYSSNYFAVPKGLQYYRTETGITFYDQDSGETFGHIEAKFKYGSNAATDWHIFMEDLSVLDWRYDGSERNGDFGGYPVDEHIVGIPSPGLTGKILFFTPRLHSAYKISLESSNPEAGSVHTWMDNSTLSQNIMMPYTTYCDSSNVYLWNYTFDKGHEESGFCNVDWMYYIGYDNSINIFSHDWEYDSTNDDPEEGSLASDETATIRPVAASDGYELVGWDVYDFAGNLLPNSRFGIISYPFYATNGGLVPMRFVAKFAPTGTTVNVGGNVVDVLTDQPIPGVKLTFKHDTLTASENNEITSAVTDENGNFTLVINKGVGGTLTIDGSELGYKVQTLEFTAEDLESDIKLENLKLEKQDSPVPPGPGPQPVPPVPPVPGPDNPGGGAQTGDPLMPVTCLAILVMLGSMGYCITRKLRD